jgi:hypothetical protein
LKGNDLVQGCVLLVTPFVRLELQRRKKKQQKIEEEE